MEYKAKLPLKNTNVSQAKPFQEFSVLLLGLGTVIIAIYWLLGLLVNYVVDVMPEEQVTAIYLSLNEVESAVVKDEPLEQSAINEQGKPSKELQGLFDDLTKISQVSFPLSLTIADNTDINAMALPTGSIIVYQALLDNINSENGLAFVLAHEIAHFKNRDHLRASGRGLLLLSASLLLGFGDSDVLGVMSPITDLTTATFSQERESAADASALIILNEYYGHVGGATDFFEVLQQTKTNQLDEFLHYYSSHPHIEQRIESLHKQSQTMGFVVGPIINNNFD